VEVPIYQFVVDYKDQDPVRAVLVDAIRDESIELSIGKHINVPRSFAVGIRNRGTVPRGSTEGVFGKTQLLENGPSQKAWLRFVNPESPSRVEVESTCQMTSAD
jgi:hypothetical protein